MSATPCPKYLKYLSKQTDERRNEERLVFPSTLSSCESVNYDFNQNYCHCELFERPSKAALLTEMKDSYNEPTRSFTKNNGIRRYLLESYLLDKRVKDQMLKFTPNINSTMDFNTEYNSNFHNLPSHQHLREFHYDFSHAHSLYGVGSNPVTFYTSTFNAEKPNNISAPFRKSTHFTKPLAESMDKDWIL